MDRLKKIAKAVCNGTATIEAENYVKSMYQRAFGVPFSDCKCQLCDSVFKIIKKLSIMSTYKIKKGACLTLFGDPRILNSETITDELAKEFLTKKPEYAKYFDYIPQPLILKEVAKVEAETNQITPTYQKTYKRRK
jgi:hypothetical protein